jgi:DNA glycosylase AlkZ-like
VNERVLTQRELNRALLARQLLLERVKLPIPRAVERIGCVQNQYAPNGYIRLWSCLEGFRREQLTRALERRSIVQATLMRGTIHLASKREFWLYASGIRRARREWWLRLRKVSDGQMQEGADRLRTALDRGPRSVKELGDLAKGFLGNVGLWVDLVRVPPSGTWEQRRADLLALADDWVGHCHASEQEGLEQLVRGYLRGFGPAPLGDVASWAGIPVTSLKPVAGRLELRRFHDEQGKELIDLPRAPLPDPETPAPIRFLPTWDATLLVHARRTQILPERFRARVFHAKNPFSVGTVLVDGAVAGEWKYDKGRVLVTPYERLSREARREVDDEAERLAAFHS